MAIVSQGKKMRGWKCETNRKPRYHAQGRVSSSLNGGRKRKKKKRKKIFSRFSRVSRLWSLRPPWLKCFFIILFYFLNIQKCLKFYFSSSWLNSLTFMRFKINWIVFPTSDKFLKILIEKFFKVYFIFLAKFYLFRGMG